MAESESLTEISPGVLSWNVNESTRHALVTTAIGGHYLQDFVEFSLPTWQLYSKRHGLGIVVFSDHSVSDEALEELNGAWVKMLSPKLLEQHFPWIERLALADTDIIINPSSPNVFDATPEGYVGVVPEFSSDPSRDIESKKRMAFLRRSYYDPAYPLDSILFASAEQVYAEEGFEPLRDSFCSGLLVLDVAFSPDFSRWFEEAKDLDSGRAVFWEQTYLNHRVLTQLPHHWLDEKFQVIWNLDMALFHPSLYQLGDLSNSEIAESCVADTLNRVHFLHFAGSWPESSAWRNSPHKVMEKMCGLFEPEFLDYVETPSTGVAKGKIFVQPS